MNIARLLLRSARVFPQRPALLQGAHLLHDYQSLARRVAALAGHLRGPAGVQPGDRVVLYGANAPAYLEAQQAIHWCGAVMVPVNYKLHARELAHVLADSGARLVCASPELREAALQAGAAPERLLVLGGPAWEQAATGAALALHQAAPEDLAWLFYTSGTTGRPKGVMLSQRNLLAMTMAYFTDVDQVDPGDAMVYAAPMSHGAGLYQYAHMLRGARHVVPESGGFDPAELADLATHVGRLSLFAAPTMVHRLVAHLQRSGRGGEGFKTIVYGGGPMYVEDLRRAMDVMGQKFVQIYGQGESPMTITALAREHLAASDHPRWRERIASVGVAHACVQVRVADADDRDLPTGEMGEVLVRGDTVMAGYWNNPEATATTLRGGWLHTGDIGSLDADGFLTLRDRSKDVIISGGSNIYPREVEEVLLTHPRVSEVAVVGERDADWGEIVVAFLVADGEPVPDAELDALCLAHIARFKRPKHYRWLPSLPKNAYGKVLKTELRAKVG
ncbi:AMP-binding protein [Comamonas flocculans]|uniref:Long-chain fatty acid--CoA ligase n=1 Tax=Comamonas flocculans TaxID=2597701 RepID=A0A5B8RRP6_9BURK|nr:AMP-binding protein [Comamonas flocculans]QEA12226.1 long-chain fatty acid--CoA ligase [Comamonas flocculans]